METQSSVESHEDKTAKIDSSSTKKSARRVFQPDSKHDSFRNSDIELTQSSIQEDKFEHGRDESGKKSK